MTDRLEEIRDLVGRRVLFRPYEVEWLLAEVDRQQAKLAKAEAVVAAAARIPDHVYNHQLIGAPGAVNLHAPDCPGCAVNAALAAWDEEVAG